jgi:hypothetical protein
MAATFVVLEQNLKSMQILRKDVDIKFPELPSSCIQVAPSGRTEEQTGRHEQTRIAFLNFANATEMCDGKHWAEIEIKEE